MAQKQQEWAENDWDGTVFPADTTHHSYPPYDETTTDINTFNTELFSQFLNSPTCDSPAQYFDASDGDRSDGTATFVRRDTGLPPSAFINTSSDASTQHSPASSVSSAHIKVESPDADISTMNMPACQQNLGYRSSSLNFAPDAADAYDESNSTGLFSVKKEFDDSSALWDNASVMTGNHHIMANPLQSAFEELISTPQATAFNATATAPTFDFASGNNSPLAVATPTDPSSAMFTLSSGATSPTEIQASHQHSPIANFAAEYSTAFAIPSPYSNGNTQSLSPDHETGEPDLDALPSQLVVDLSDTKRRVETQVPVTLSLTSPPDGAARIHLQPETIPKLKKISKIRARSADTLELHTQVVCESAMKKPGMLMRARRRAAGLPVASPVHSGLDVDDNDKSPDLPLKGGEVKICLNCIDRERKRAGRQKVKKVEEDEHFDEYAGKRIIVFNPKEGDTLNLYPPSPSHEELHRPLTTLPDGAMQFMIPMRICCYCRHHNETEGFQVIFTLRDHLDRLIAQGVSSTLMITDDHKTPDEKKICTAYGGYAKGLPMSADGQSFVELVHQHAVPQVPFVSHTPKSSLPQSGFEPSLSSTNLHQQAFGAMPQQPFTPLATPKLQTSFSDLQHRQPGQVSHQSAYGRMPPSPFPPDMSKGLGRPYHSMTDLETFGQACGMSGLPGLSSPPSCFLGHSQSTSATPRNLSRPASPTFSQSTNKRRKNRPELTMTSSVPTTMASPVSPQVGKLVQHMYAAFHLVDEKSPQGYTVVGQVMEHQQVGGGNNVWEHQILIHQQQAASLRQSRQQQRQFLAQQNNNNNNNMIVFPESGAATFNFGGNGFGRARFPSTDFTG